MRQAQTIRTYRSFLKIVLLVLTVISLAHAKPITADDYQRANNINRTFSNKVLNENVHVHWLKCNKKLWYKREISSKASEFVLVDAETGKKDKAFDHKKLAKALAKVTNKKVNFQKLPVDHIGVFAAYKSVPGMVARKRR